MKRIFLILGLLLCALPASAAISDTGVGCAVAGTGTTCGSSGVITTAVGDYIYAFAFRSATTAPTLPSGWTQIATASASSSSMRSGCRVATATTTTVSGWTNATDLVIEVYRGTAATTTANCVTAGIGCKTTGGASGTTSTVSYTGCTFTNIGGGSWVVSASGSSAHTCTPANQSVKQTVTGPVAVENDSNGIITSYTTSTCTGTTGNWKSDTFELLAKPCNGDSFGNGVTCVQSTSNSIAGTSATATYTLTGVSASNAVVIHNSSCDNGTCTAAVNTSTIADSGTSSCVASHNSPFSTNGGATQMFITYIWLCTGLSAGSHTWTITYSANEFFSNGGASEWSGLTAPAAFDASNGDAANVATSTNPTVTTGANTTNAKDLIYGINAQATSITPTQGSGYNTVLYNVNGILAEAKTVAATGSQTAAFVSASQTWHAMIAPIIISTPAAGCSGSRLLLTGAGC